MRRRKIISLFLLICFILSILPLSNISVAAASGSWTDEGIRATSFSTTGTNTITINNAAELGLLAYNVNNGVSTYSGYTISLANDLDLSAHYWVAIGTSTTYKFAGIFDGCRFIISGLYINNSYSNQGLFGYIVGAIIRNVGVQGEITSTGSNIGGLAGSIRGTSTVANCFVNVNVSGGTYVGGVAGYITGSYIYNCISCGTLSGTTVGGVLGRKGIGGAVSYNYWLYGTATNACGSGTITYSYSFNSINTLCTLNNTATYTIGTTTIAIGDNLLTALNAWVTTNGTSTYKTWRNAESTTENNGCPVFLEIIDVALTWSSLEYTCYPTWHTDTCNYTYSWSQGYETTITNTSDTAITATFVYDSNTAGAGTTLTFYNYYSGYNNPVIVNKNSNEAVTMSLGGVPVNPTAWNSTEIGTVTVTITPVEG